jgi:predicted ATPase/signal transduction histidine kinase/ActR/RegA family two-component response regulator
LDIALKITKCLAYLNKKQVIHKDINPSNIVYNPDNKVVKLIDLGIASEFSFQTMQALNPNKLEGTLPYLSPEQTGRMNRPLDYRTDFYSLGVTLYELACAKLPFVSDYPAQMVHSHIALNPLPVHEINPLIPKILSGIITKLMSKIPEERYKNATGILFDLDKCLKELDSKRNIEEFALGLGDISDKLEMPKKIYGRKQELASLLTSYQNICKGKAEFILIGGYSGIGKTSLVNELYKPIAQEQGMFISGKYDQFNRNIPYSAFFQAVDQFCRYILAEPEIEIERWKKRILETLGSKGRLITEVVPRLELIIGEQPVLKDLVPLEKQAMFKIALKNWLLVISSPEHPVVLFMDDVHWADMASLDLFENILLDSAIKGLLFIGAYRDNEVDASHPLIRSLERIKKNDGKIEIIKLGNLNLQAVAQMISDLVYRPEEEVFQLARVVLERTLGNPFYTIEFLKHCNEKNLIYYDHSETRWKWNETSIRSSKIADNVADYLIGKIKTLPADTQDLVTRAACIGNHFDMKVLSAIAEKDAEEIAEWLKPAEEMIYVSGKKEDNPTELQFQFCHDKFQQAGYQALPDNIQKTIHIKIARYYEEIEKSEGNSNIFIIADHYSKALDCLSASLEIEHAIQIFLKAVQAAILSSAFDTARIYLELIIEIMPDNLKNDNLFLQRLYTEYHLVLYSLANYDQLDKIYIRIEEIIRNPVDLTNSCCLQLISLSNRGRFREACLMGISLLKKLGVDFPEDSLTEEIQAEIEKFYEYKRNGKIKKLEKLGILDDPQGQAIARILLRLLPAGSFDNPLISLWAMIVNTNLMLEKGITADALAMCTSLNMVFSIFKNDYLTGYEMAKLALQIVSRKGFIAELYSMYSHFGLLVCHWFEPVETDIYYAHESYKGCLQNGEFEIACYSFHASQIAILENCSQISEMQAEVEAALAFAKRTGNLHSLAAFVSFRQLVKTLKGETVSFGSFNDDAFDENKHLKKINYDFQGLSIFYIYKSLAAVLSGNFKTALELTEKAAPLIPCIGGFYSIALRNFLHSLAICKVIPEIEDSTEKQSLRKTLEANQAWLYQRAQDAPFNFFHLYDLIDAEIKALEENFGLAFRLYEKAILGAKENNRPYHYALACELLGQLYLKMGIAKTAGFYLKEAYSAFLSWEAIGKTEAMKEKYPQFLFSGMESKKLELSLKNTILTSSWDINDLNNSIDIEAVIKSAQTISREIKKEKLLAKLMSIIMENSGGNRGYILLKDGKRWALSAFAIINSLVENYIDNQEIFLESLETNQILPLSLITYVLRTKEPVIIGNTLANQFSSDNYFSGKTALSAICFPILAQNLLKGIIYLENDLLTEAFNQERLELLSILAAQAAISLENSLLYTELEDKVTERTKQLQEALSKLEQQHEKLKSTQLKLVQSEKMAGVFANDITERKLAEKALRESKEQALELVEKLSQADKNKNAFLNMLSHELRNPLASIMMSLSLQDQVPPGGEEDIKARKVMGRQTAHLSRLVDDLLDVTRITQNKITLKKEHVELNQLVKLAVADYRVSFTEKEVGLKTELSSNLLYLEADPARLTQVIGNLLHNASKFTSKGDQVFVAVYYDERTQEAIITVQDNGIGIKPEILPNLFEPFMQVDSTLDRSNGGLGLGLAIVKGMVELHGGSVSVHSEGLDKGTRLTIRLPLTTVEAGKKEQGSKTGGSSACSFRILIIDDIPDIAEILSSLLRSLGHEVTAVFSGPEGITKANEFHPEVVICDIGLPGMSGYEVARSLRSDKELKDIFLIALSGYAQPEDLERSIEAGFDTHLAKPVNLDTLEQTLAKASYATNRKYEKPYKK